MATSEVTLKNSHWRVKVQNPAHVVILDFVTLGVYGAIWYFRVNTELAALGRARNRTDLGDNPTRSLLALVPGIILIVPAVISMINTVKRIEAAQRGAGLADDQRISIPAGAALLLLLAPFGCGYAQGHLNALWAIEGEAAALDEGAPEPAAVDRQDAPAG